ncbi:unnamed protein product [Calicophoron daubneyi]|uniref:Proteasome assembly chaperone 2 n=1 Tax=Calicophoron daubneyi TaxID=300641 RepID=A0AAV2TUH7_CALDB
MSGVYYAIGGAGDGSTNPTERWGSYTAIVTCVGVGNVAQLACDLLVNNLQCTLAADLNFRYVAAIVGSNPYDSPTNALTTSSQLFVDDAHKLVLLQTRSPPFSGCRKKHVNELADFLKSVGFHRIVIISSSSATQQKDAELLGSRMRYATNKLFDQSDIDTFQSRNWMPLLPHTEDIDEYLPQYSKSLTYWLPGSGIASHLFQAFIHSPTDRVCLLNVFASEGDNTGDALYFAKCLDEWLNLMPGTDEKQSSNAVWHLPPSWSLLYGSKASERLY